MATFTYEWEPELECLSEDEYYLFEVEVEYDYSPGSPGCHTLSNGDPGYPADPSYTEIIGNGLIRAVDSEGNEVSTEKLAELASRIQEDFFDLELDKVEKFFMELFEKDIDVAILEERAWEDAETHDYGHDYCY